MKIYQINFKTLNMKNKLNINQVSILFFLQFLLIKLYGLLNVNSLLKKPFFFIAARNSCRSFSTISSILFASSNLFLTLGWVELNLLTSLGINGSFIPSECCSSSIQFFSFSTRPLLSFSKLSNISCVLTRSE